MKYSFFIIILFFLACKSSGPGQEQLKHENQELSTLEEQAPEVKDNEEEELIAEPPASVACLKSCGEHKGAQERSDCSLEAILEFVNQELKYPEEAKNNSITGMALIRFNIEKDGTTSSLEIVQDPGSGCGEEALRVISSFLDKSEWEPANAQGTTIPSQYMVPIQFRL